MSWSVVSLVLLAAAMHAGWNTMVKVQADRFTVLALLAVPGGIISIFALPFVSAPAPESWPFMALSVLLHIGYNLFLVETYRHGDLSQVYPIARGTSPVLIMLLAAVFTDEAITPVAGTAVVIVSLGIISLAFSGKRTSTNQATVLWAFGTSGWIAAYTVTDGIGARLAGSPHNFVVWLNLFWALPLVMIGFYRQGHVFLGSMQAVWKPGFIGGTIATLGYWIVIWAMTLAPFAAVSALRETSVIIAALIGAFMLKEHVGLWRIGAAAIVAGGIVLMRVAG